jgi:hypothetical protein
MSRRLKTGRVSRFAQQLTASSAVAVILATGCGHHHHPVQVSRQQTAPPPPAAYPPQTAESQQPRPATWYTAPYKGRKAANGEVFSDHALTAAHRTLPMGSLIVVTNLKTASPAPCASPIADRLSTAESSISPSHRPRPRASIGPARPRPPRCLPDAQAHRIRRPLVRADRRFQERAQSRQSSRLSSCASTLTPT